MVNTFTIELLYKNDQNNIWKKLRPQLEKRLAAGQNISIEFSDCTKNYKIRRYFPVNLSKHQQLLEFLKKVEEGAYSITSIKTHDFDTKDRSIPNIGYYYIEKGQLIATLDDIRDLVKDECEMLDKKWKEERRIDEEAKEKAELAELQSMIQQQKRFEELQSKYGDQKQ